MTNYSWVEKELQSRGYSAEEPDQAAVVKAVMEVFYTLDAQVGLDDDLRRTAVGQVHDLLRSSHTSIERGTDEHSQWRQFYLGNVPVGATVRVKPNAYTSQTGRRYNGLVGTLIAGRGGRAVVRFIGRQDATGHYLDPKTLDVLDRK